MSALYHAIRFISDPGVEGLHKLRQDGTVEAYADPLKGWSVPTIGFGTTVYPDTRRKVGKGDVRTQRECFLYLMAWLENVALPASRLIPLWGRMTQFQQAALLSFTYNLGPFYQKPSRQSITALCDASSRWDEDDYVREVFVKYRNPGSNVEAGLKKRRLAEAELWLGGGSS